MGLFWLAPKSMKDHEALKLTVERCCNADVLAPGAPECIRSLAAVTKGSNPAQRKIALADLAACFSATLLN
jgi:hypothetical protein